MSRVTHFATVALIVAMGASAKAQSSQEEKALRQRLDAVAKKWLTESRVPALSLAIVREGQLLHEGAYGTIDLEHEVAARPEAWFRIGAITMAFTATATLALVDSGALSLEAELSDLLPEVPLEWPKITLKQLLQHTSGIGNYTSAKAFRDRMREDHDQEEILRLIVATPREFAPGTRWAFNPSNYYLLGVILERKGGASYERVLQEHAFGPAKAGLAYDDQRRILRHRARGYEVVQGRRRRADFVSMEAPFAAAGLIARAKDLAQWMDALAAGQILNPKSLRLMTERTLLADQTPVDYGMGLAIGRLSAGPIWAHQGFVAGFSAHLQHYPERKLTVVVLANASTQLIGQIAGALAAECFEEVRESEPVQRFDRIVGTYRFGEERFEIRSEANGLVLMLPLVGAVPLIAVSADRFEDQAARGIVITVLPEKEGIFQLAVDLGLGPKVAERVP